MNLNLLVHFQKLSSNEVFVDYQSLVLFEVLLSFQQNPLIISVSTLADLIKCSEVEVSNSLKFIQQQEFILLSFASPDSLINNEVQIDFDLTLVQRISDGNYPKIKSDKVSQVYLIRNNNNGQIKIGRSNNPERRLKTLLTSTTDDLEIIKTIPSNSASQMESNLHQKFRHKRINREWFALTEDDIKFIDSLVRPDFAPKKVYDDSNEDDDLVF
jgi:predicted GIY-YIG superfamily endonuclease